MGPLGCWGEGRTDRPSRVSRDRVQIEPPVWSLGQSLSIPLVENRGSLLSGTTWVGRWG